MVKVRKFALSDLRRILEIEKRAFAYPYSGDYFKKLFQRYAYGFIVAEEQGKIVGYAIGRPKNGSGEIVSIAVGTDWQGRGVGQTLANSLINHFKELGFKKVFLHVRTGNQVAISFYQRLGFKTIKTIANYYSNGDNAYLMGKEI